MNASESAGPINVRLTRPDAFTVSCELYGAARRLQDEGSADTARRLRSVAYRIKMAALAPEIGRKVRP